MRRLVLLNPAAGGGRAAHLEAPLRERLHQRTRESLSDRSGDKARARGEHDTLIVTRSAEHLRNLLQRCEPGTRIVIVGGDGSLQNALPALVAGRLEVGLVTCGSGNDLARALGVVRLGWREALDLALDGRPGAVDLGEARIGGTSHWFASSLTAGFDSAIVRRTTGRLAALPGRLKYLVATLAEIGRLRHWPLRVRADGAAAFDGESLFASVLNTPTYGSGLPAVPQARIDDHRLDLLVAGRFDRPSVLAMLPRLMLGRHLGDPRVRTQPFTTLELECVDGRVPVAADGELIGEASRIDVQLHPAAIGIVRRVGGQSPAVPSGV